MRSGFQVEFLGFECERDDGTQSGVYENWVKVKVQTLSEAAPNMFTVRGADNTMGPVIGKESWL